ncbi:MAG: hypothetical protein AAGA36_00075 [Pseudomonadota bacterium]
MAALQHVVLAMSPAETLRAAKAHPILFSGPMVRALLAGRKTQTRRVGSKPKYAVGDLLWVRESHYMTDDGYCGYAVFACDEQEVAYHFAEIDRAPYLKPEIKAEHKKLRPSIFLPKWASRLTLKVTDIKVERVHEISDEDAVAEGACFWSAETDEGYLASDQVPRNDFAKLWDSINGKDRAKCWGANPWVIAYSFTVHERNVLEMMDG